MLARSPHRTENLYSHFLLKDIKFKLHKTIISPVIWCGLEVLSVSLMKEYIFRKFYSRLKVCGRYLDPKQRKQPEDDGNYMTVAYPGIFFGGGSTNSVEDRDNRDLGVVVP